jgi:hypothetical protein
MSNGVGSPSSSNTSVVNVDAQATNTADSDLLQALEGWVEQLHGYIDKLEQGVDVGPLKIPSAITTTTTTTTNNSKNKKIKKKRNKTKSKTKTHGQERREGK